MPKRPSKEPPRDPATEEALRRIKEARKTDATLLDLSKLKLIALPEAIGQLTQLRTLDLSYNQLIVLPEAIGQLTKLQTLYLPNSRLIGLPKAIGQLTKLRKLDLSGNQLSTLLEAIGWLTQLQELNLSGNQLSTLPEAIGRLTTLQRLYLSDNQLSMVPETIGQLTQLQTLDLSYNRLGKLPEGISQLTKLQTLYLSGNGLRKLPEAISQLIQLQTLHLSYNQLRTLPEAVSRLTKLQELNLSDNQLSTLPEPVQSLEALEKLFLHGNPDLGIPDEVLGPTIQEVFASQERSTKPSREILDYFFRINPPEREGKRAGQVLRELKVIFVGRGGVGKTSLIEVLKGGKFVEGTTKKTEGIATTRWPLMLPDGEATALVWDFGGQEIMHGTHQFFLTGRSLYLAVVEGRHDRAKQDAEYWLKLIRAFGGQSPVIVVLNAQRRHAFDTDREYLAKKYGVALEHFFRTDCADEESVGQLRKAIEHEAVEMLTPKELFPAEWWEVKQYLGTMREEHGENYLSDERYENLCKQRKVGKKDAEILLRRLADLGTVVSFPDRQLRELTVLNPEWVTDGIYRVLNDGPLREQRHGQLAWGELTRILPEDRWPEKWHRYLVELMRKFELCFPLEGELELVPELLPDKTPPLEDWKPAESLVFFYQYLVLLHGVLPRFITRTHHKSQGRTDGAAEWCSPATRRRRSCARITIRTR